MPNLSFDKKILLLDLDETLIHADFDEEFSKDEYDNMIKNIKNYLVEQLEYNKQTIENIYHNNKVPKYIFC